MSGRIGLGRLDLCFFAAGLAAHYFALLERARGLHTVPYHDLSGSMSLFGWLLALTYLSLELFHRQRSVGFCPAVRSCIFHGVAARSRPTASPRLLPPASFSPFTLT